MRRLTKSQKTSILEAFREGKTTQELSEEYKCSPNTVIRTVKTLTTKEEYSALKEERSKEQNIRLKTVSLQLDGFKKKAIEVKTELLIDENPKALLDQLEVNKHKVSDVNQDIQEDIQADKEEENGELNLDFKEQFEQENSEELSKIEELVPLISSFGFETEKQKVACKSLDVDDLPDSVYMLVDKKVELEYQKISELTEWSFLPDSEKERQAILLFNDQRTAKRNCSRSQRVIKIPDTNIFEISRPFLISKGITRIIFEDKLIGLDVK